MQELEAKFLAAPGADPERALRRLQESLAWAGFRIRPALRRQLTDTYFDTPEQQLRRAGWSLREREEAGGRQLTLKEVNRARAAIFDRQEIEQLLQSADDDPRRPPRGAVQECLQQLLAPGAVVAQLFSVETERTSYRLSHTDHADALVELSFDQTRIRADATLEFIEVEFELKQGPHDLLADVLAVAELEPGLLDARLSKYERGLITASCAEATPSPPWARSFDSQSSWLEIGIAQLKSQLAQIKRYEPYAWEGIHPEGVHQMRVATRRAAAALQTFAQVLPADEAERLAERLGGLAATLGEVRDLDVHLASLAGYYRKLKPFQRHRLAGYEAYLHELHRAARRKLLKALAGETYANLLRDARALLIAAARAENGSSLRAQDVAQAAVAKPLKQVNRRGRGVTRRPTDAELHRLRRSCKRLRYQIECLQSPYGHALDDVMQALRGLQDNLGAHQDACVAWETLQHYRRARVDSRQERRIIGKLIDLERRRAQRQRKRLLPAWLKFQQAGLALLQRLEPVVTSGAFAANVGKHGEAVLVRSRARDA